MVIAFLIALFRLHVVPFYHSELTSGGRHLLMKYPLISHDTHSTPALFDGIPRELVTLIFRKLSFHELSQWRVNSSTREMALRALFSQSTPEAIDYQKRWLRRRLNFHDDLDALKMVARFKVRKDQPILRVLLIGAKIHSGCSVKEDEWKFLKTRLSDRDTLIDVVLSMLPCLNSERLDALFQTYLKRWEDEDPHFRFVTMSMPDMLSHLPPEQRAKALNALFDRIERNKEGLDTVAIITDDRDVLERAERWWVNATNTLVLLAPVLCFHEIKPFVEWIKKRLEGEQIKSHLSYDRLYITLCQLAAFYPEELADDVVYAIKCVAKTSDEFKLSAWGWLLCDEQAVKGIECSIIQFSSKDAKKIIQLLMDIILNLPTMLITAFLHKPYESYARTWKARAARLLYQFKQHGYKVDFEDLYHKLNRKEKGIFLCRVKELVPYLSKTSRLALYRQVQATIENSSISLDVRRLAFPTLAELYPYLNKEARDWIFRILCLAMKSGDAYSRNFALSAFIKLSSTLSFLTEQNEKVLMNALATVHDSPIDQVAAPGYSLIGNMVHLLSEEACLTLYKQCLARLGQVSCSDCIKAAIYNSLAKIIPNISEVDRDRIARNLTKNQFSEWLERQFLSEPSPVLLEMIHDIESPQAQQDATKTLSFKLLEVISDSEQTLEDREKACKTLQGLLDYVHEWDANDVEAFKSELRWLLAESSRPINAITDRAIQMYQNLKGPSVLDSSELDAISKEWPVTTQGEFQPVIFTPQKRRLDALLQYVITTKSQYAKKTPPDLLNKIDAIVEDIYQLAQDKTSDAECYATLCERLRTVLNDSKKPLAAELRERLVLENPSSSLVNLTKPENELSPC